MNVVGLMTVRLDAWCFGYSVRSLLRCCDHVVVLFHRKPGEEQQVDPCYTLLRQLPAEDLKRVQIALYYDAVWNEADHRQRTLDMGRRLGGTHFVVLDADEALTLPSEKDLRAHLFHLDEGQSVAANLVSPWHWHDQRRTDGAFATPDYTFAFADAPGLAFTPDADGYQQHQRLPRGLVPMRCDALRVFHFQYVYRGLLEAKAVWYKMRETLEHPGRRTPAELNATYDWALVAEPPAGSLAPIPPDWYSRDLAEHLCLDHRPWQADEIHAMLAEHGPDRFAGLKLWSYDPDARPHLADAVQ